MSHSNRERGGDRRRAREKKKRDTARAAQKERVSRSKRSNVRGGESRSSFGTSGAGSNRAAITQFGSPEAQNARSRPLTRQERAFGANPQQKTNAEAIARATQLHQQAQAFEQSRLAPSQPLPPSAPTRFGGISIQEDPSPPTIAEKFGAGLKEGFLGDFGGRDPKTLGGLEGAGALAGVIAGFGGRGRAAKGFGFITKNTASQAARGAEEAARLAGVDKAIKLAVEGKKATIIARDKFLRGSNLKQVWANLAKENDLGVVIGTLAKKGNARAIPLNTKNKKLIETAVTVAWGDRSATFRKLMIKGMQASAGTGALAMWWNKETADGFDFMSSEFYRNSRFAESEEERQIVLAAAQESYDAYEESMSRDVLDWMVTFLPGVNLLREGSKTLVRAKQRNDARWDVINDVNALVTAHGGVAGGANGEANDTDFWSEYQKIANENELAEIDAIKDSRISTEKELLALRKEAEQQGFTEKAKYYAESQANQLQLEKDKLQAQKEYWVWYYQYVDLMRERTTPSKLNFGLL